MGSREKRDSALLPECAPGGVYDRLTYLLLQSELCFFKRQIKNEIKYLTLCVFLSQVVAGDVGCLEDVQNAVQTIGSLGWPPLQGVFHLAGVLADAALLQQSRKGYVASFSCC
jgi:hypothetical protein